MSDCDKCEELLQGYLDRELSAEEVAVAEMHLEGCDYCRRRYRFEASLRSTCGRRPRSGCRRASWQSSRSSGRPTPARRRSERYPFRSTAPSRSRSVNGPVAPAPAAYR